MKLSDRDLKLLILLLIAVVIACPIFFVLRPYNTKIQETEAHIAELQTRQAFLAKLNENRQFYFDSIDLLDNERSKLIEQYAKGLRDENTVMFLANTEKQLPIAMRTLSFTSGEPTEITEAYVNDQGEVVEGLSAYTSMATVEFVAQYDAFKSFLSYIMSNQDKMVLSSVSADQDDMDGTIKGVFILNQYAVSGEGRELDAAKIPAMEHHVDNIFGVPSMLEEEEPAPEEGGEETN